MQLVIDVGNTETVVAWLQVPRSLLRTGVSVRLCPGQAMK